MQNKHFLYRHIRLDKNEVFYIGIGTKKEWFTDYRTEYRRAFETINRKLYWKRIVAKTPYVVEIILESDDYNFIKEKEKEFIKSYGRKDLKLGTLTNLTNGGEGTLGYIATEEVRKRMGLSRKGKFRDGIKVYQYSKNGTFIQEWNSLSEAEKKLSIFSECISRCTKGKISSAGGYFWSKTKNFTYSRPIRSFCKTVYQYSIEGEFIKKWNSIIEASIELNISHSAINRCLLGKSKSSKGFLWDYKLKENKSYLKSNREFKRINKIDSNGVIVKSYNSMREIHASEFPEKSFKCVKNVILKALLGTRPSAYKYIWKYDNQLKTTNN